MEPAIAQVLLLKRRARCARWGLSVGIATQRVDEHSTPAQDLRQQLAGKFGSGHARQADIRPADPKPCCASGFSASSAVAHDVCPAFRLASMPIVSRNTLSSTYRIRINHQMACPVWTEPAKMKSSAANGVQHMPKARRDAPGSTPSPGSSGQVPWPLWDKTQLARKAAKRSAAISAPVCPQFRQT